MSTSTLLTSLFEHKAWANRELFAEMARVDEALHAERRHLALRILNHVHVADRIFVAHLSGEPHGYTSTNTEATPTLDALRTDVEACDAWYLDHARRLSAAQLDEVLSFRFTDGDAGRMSRAEILAHIITHGAYHRGAVGQLLREAGVPPPRDLLTRYLHQHEPERRSA